MVKKEGDGASERGVGVGGEGVWRRGERRG